MMLEVRTIKKSLAVKDLTSELFSKISLNFDNFPKKMKILCCMKKGLPTRFFEVCDTHGSLPFSIILANVESNWKELYSLESELKCVCKWILLGFPCQFGWYHTACQYPAKISCAATPVNNQPKTKMDRMKKKIDHLIWINAWHMLLMRFRVGFFPNPFWFILKSAWSAQTKRSWNMQQSCNIFPLAWRQAVAMDTKVQVWRSNFEK